MCSSWHALCASTIKSVVIKEQVLLFDQSLYKISTIMLGEVLTLEKHSQGIQFISFIQVLSSFDMLVGDVTITLLEVVLMP